MIEPSEPPRWRPASWLPWVGYLLFALVLFVEVFFASARLINRDLLHYFLPLGETLARAWRGEGSFLWDSGVDVGMPLAASWSPAVFYPAHALFALLPVDLALSLAIILHFPLAAVAMRQLALRYADSPIAAWIAGLGYGFGGYLLSMAGGGIYLYGAALLPLNLLALHRLLERPDASRLVQLALVLALQIFCADPQTLFFNVLLLWPPLLLLGSRRPGPAATSRPGGRRRATLGAAAAGLLAIGIAFCQLWPSLELTGLSVRAGGLGYQDLAIWSFHPLRLLEVVVPAFFGGTTPDTLYWAGALVDHPQHALPWAPAVHVGLPLLLGALWLPRREQRRGLLLWGLATVAFLLLALGSHAPLHRLLLSVLPGAAYFRYPEKFMVFVALGLSLVGAMGLGRLLRPGETGAPLRRGWLALGLTGAVLVVLRVVCDPGSPARLPWLRGVAAQLRPHRLVQLQTSLQATAEALSRSAALALVLMLLLLAWPRLRGSIRAALLLALASVDLLLCALPLRHLGGRSWLREPPLACRYLPAPQHGLAPLLQRIDLESIPNVIPDGEPFARLSSVNEKVRAWQRHSLLANVGVPSCVRHLEGYQSARLLTFARLLGALPPDRPDAVAPVFGLSVALAEPGALDPGRYPVRAEIPALHMLVHQTSGLPYVHAVGSAELAAGPAEAVARVVSRDFTPGSRVVLEGDRIPFEASLSPAVAGARRRVQLQSHRPGLIELEADFAAPGYAVVLESYYPGWRATVGGRPVELRRANGHFMALPVQAGRHLIRLSFEPRRQRVGNAVSLASLALAGALLVLAAWRACGRRAARSAPPGDDSRPAQP